MSTDTEQSVSGWQSWKKPLSRAWITATAMSMPDSTRPTIRSQLR